MKKRNVLKFGVLGVAVLALATFAPSASAAVIGHLDFTNCAAGTVVVNYATIDFTLPVLGGNGCIVAGNMGANPITFNGAPGIITPGETGTVNDLGFGAPGSGNAGFITFTGVLFNLVTIGPGVANLTCSNAFDPNGSACAAFAGSPFILAPTASGTSITLSVGGLATDSTSSNSPWSGAFTTQITGSTPLSIRNTICGPAAGCTGVGGGTITPSTYSFDGIAGVPEPVSMALIGGGLLALAGLKRRKARS